MADERMRGFFADLVTARGGARDPALRDAFAAVDRVAHVGPGPWQVSGGAGYIATPSADPCFVYQDVAIALAPDRGINNGEPALHARCIAAAAPRPGDHVLHVGAGTGYYTAILARLVAPDGTVVAYEPEADLAARAAQLLSGEPHVTVIPAYANEPGLPASDVIYVCAGVTHVPDVWLDALRPGGRLVVPLTPDQGMGLMLLVTRTSGPAFQAAVLAGVAFIGCNGPRNAAESAALQRALAGGGHASVRSLRRGEPPDDTAWLTGKGWWLSRREADQPAGTGTAPAAADTASPGA